MSQATAYIGLGSNQGDRERNIRTAISLIAQLPGVQAGPVSSLIESAPLGDSGGPDYLNAAAQIRTALPPQEVLSRLLDIENKLGRARTQRWGPRTIDLDLLLYDDVVINSPDLCLPHRQLHLRSFVLAGLCELEPGKIHPVLKTTMRELADRLNGGDFFIDPSLPQLVCVAGLIGVGKTTLVSGLAGLLGAEAIFEEYDTNPYLPQVYAGRQDAALDSELYFLSSSVRQIGRDRLSPGRVYITDYIFDKARIYAGCWLSPRQLIEYEKFYPQQARAVAKPALVIYLHDSPAQCLERIHKRRRPYEQNITLDFMEGFERKYQQLISGWKQSPVIRQSARQCRSPEQLGLLAEQIRYYLAKRDDKWTQ